MDLGLGPDDGPRTEPPAQDWWAWSKASSWQEGSRIRIAQLLALHGWLRGQGYSTADEPSQKVIIALLDTAASELSRSEKLWHRLSSQRFEKVLLNCDTAEGLLLRLAPDDYLYGELPNLTALVEAHVPVGDPRRIRMEQIAAQVHRDTEDRADLDRSDRMNVLDAVAAARRNATDAQMRVASWRAVVIVGALLAAAAATTLALLGAVVPTALPLCFASGQGGDTYVACPLTAEGPLQIASSEVDEVERAAASSGDALLVELVGVSAAAVPVIFGMRKLRGGTGPYGLAIPLIMAKMATGALTAVLGLMLLRGGFVPGLTALDTSGQIMLWAIVGGLAHILVTQPLDKRAQVLLEQAGRESEAQTRTRDEALLRQVTLSVPAIGPKLQESLVESVLGPPTPPYDGFVALEFARGDSAAALPPETMPIGGQVVVWFETKRPATAMSFRVRLRGSRWPPESGSDAVAGAALHFEVRLHIPESPTSPFSAALSAPVRGTSKRATIDLGKSSSISTKEPAILEVSHKGRIIEAVELSRNFDR